MRTNQYEVEGWIRSYTRGDLKNGPGAYVTIANKDNGLRAFSYLQGRGQGDLCLQLVLAIIQHEIDTHGMTVEHVIVASNKGAVLLASRHGYTYVGSNNRGNDIFVKSYS